MMPTKKQLEVWKEKGLSYKVKEGKMHRPDDEELHYSQSGFVLTRNNRMNETGKYEIRHYADGMHIRSWRK